MRFAIQLGIVSHVVVASCLSAEELKPLRAPPTVQFVVARVNGMPAGPALGGVMLREFVVSQRQRSTNQQSSGGPAVTYASSYELVPTVSFIELSDDWEITVDGRKLSHDEILAKFSSPTRVVVFQKQIDPFYADLLKPEVPVLLFKEPVSRYPVSNVGPPPTFGSEQSVSPISAPRIPAPTFGPAAPPSSGRP